MPKAAQNDITKPTSYSSDGLKNNMANAATEIELKASTSRSSITASSTMHDMSVERTIEPPAPVITMKETTSTMVAAAAIFLFTPASLRKKKANSAIIPTFIPDTASMWTVPVILNSS